MNNTEKFTNSFTSTLKEQATKFNNWVVASADILEANRKKNIKN